MSCFKSANAEVLDVLTKIGEGDMTEFLDPYYFLDDLFLRMVNVFKIRLSFL
ncbi:hypothetical protein [Flavobacterium poyangense]|uniref:hypothetical protein n=1 Tax=Flavobacterium poyangense TaxID=2204302 RepID=UPI001420DEDB|nr:hypothetical protein [Flavobacterium sp. JXAS1]